MSWAEIKKAVNSNIDVPLSEYYSQNPIQSVGNHEIVRSNTVISKNLFEVSGTKGVLHSFQLYGVEVTRKSGYYGFSNFAIELYVDGERRLRINPYGNTSYIGYVCIYIGDINNIYLGRDTYEASAFRYTDDSAAINGGEGLQLMTMYGYPSNYRVVNEGDTVSELVSNSVTYILPYMNPLRFNDSISISINATPFKTDTSTYVTEPWIDYACLYQFV